MSRLQQLLRAETARERMVGLLGRAPLEPGQGLYLSPCRAVHTFGMRYALDLVYLDRRHRIRKIVRGVRPSRMSGSWRACTTLELPAGEADRLGLACGQRLQMVSHD